MLIFLLYCCVLTLSSLRFGVGVAKEIIRSIDKIRVPDSGDWTFALTMRIYTQYCIVFLMSRSIPYLFDK